MTDLQKRILRESVHRVQALYPTMLEQSAEAFLARVVSLAHMIDPSFGRKRSSRLAPLSATTVGVNLVLRPQPAQAYFEAIDIVHANDDGSGVYRGDEGWIVYTPGATSDDKHVGSEQIWVAPARFDDVYWPVTPPTPEPKGPESEELTLEQRVSALEMLIGAILDAADTYYKEM
ncbi:MAG: hypothetical protein KKH70_20305 [Gammaproteobacteria bacterium]|nr:hypothetical protein [Gammaproteobacteria bacterium]